ncbi:MAG: hypothetical protein ABI137_14640 [Antricoccus sp.]
MPSHQTELQQFFVDYGKALVQGVVPSMTSSYAYPSAVITGEGSIVVLSEGDIHQALSGALEQYHEQHIVEAIPCIDQCMQIDKQLFEVTVTWTYRDRSEADISTESYRYFIRKSDGIHLIAATIPILTR